MKKICAILMLMVSVMFVLNGCFVRSALGGGDLMKKFEGELERNVTIQVLENDTAIEQGYFEKLLTAFNKAYEQYGIKAVDANKDQFLDLAKDGPYGYGPDVLYQANDMLMKNVPGRHILPLPIDKIDCYDKVPKVAWDAYEAKINEDEIYICGVPVNIQAPLLFYRKDLLPKDWQTTWDDDKNGIPDMVETWGNMYKYSKQVRAANSNKYGYMKSLFDVYFASGYLFSYGAYVFGDNNTNPKDIGFSKGTSEKGGQIVKQLATVMNEECTTDTITKNASVRLADGTYFATMTTPDVYTEFLNKLAINYRGEGLSKEEAMIKAKENLILTDIPKLPLSGDLEEQNPELMPCKMMGGINGYAISSYTKKPKACLEFINFATNYESMKLRNEILGVAPARNDVAEEVGGFSDLIYTNLNEEKIVVMPSIQEIKQVWSIAQGFFVDISTDAFRRPAAQKYTTLEKIKKELEMIDQRIYDAIFTLQS